MSIAKEIDFENLLKSIGSNLRIIRLSKNLKLESVAKEALGAQSHSTLSQIENGTYKALKFEHLVVLCNYYGVTLQQVLQLEITQIFEVTQKNENGATGNTLKQTVNDLAEGYKLYVEFLTAEVDRLRKLLSQISPDSNVADKP
ncbi:helix-turn-helix domain-containing protein [Sphingobacterium hotanense]|uniref:helix-turn-helix domain-containing protein n=1 Tax=Sphingobacterium TaxID=28453 RepID=UPI0021A81F3F|nr:helix-turn-helix transcriptional regulator [Sphingobacterium hotanense]MCT1523670.1 helix-turn-helix transcriptional regulator [Sphingobacterium hotanense]